MAAKEWIKQSKYPYDSQESINRIEGRTKYLWPHVSKKAKQAIEDYFAKYPDGDEFTLAVLQAIGKDALEKIGRQPRILDKKKQDLGLYVPYLLVELYGTDRVESLRRYVGHNKYPSCTRPCPLDRWPDLDWVKNFTPHRVLPE